MKLGASLAIGATSALIAANGVAAAPPMLREPVAVLQGLDKITARVSRFDAPVGRAVMFGTLSIVVRDCEKSTPEERPENAAFIQIYDSRPGEQPARRFSGWMFSSSPALSALEHPVYDINLLACTGTAAPPDAAATTSQPAGKLPGKRAE
jgi:hypothetical protein